MPGKILVCYATRYGSTAEIAEVIGEELARSGLSVDVVAIRDIKDISPYDAVVIGSPLYMGKWLIEARDFVQRFKKPLNQRNISVFSAGYSLRERTRENLQSAEAALDEVRTHINPSHTAFFAGMVDPDRMSVADREITRMGGVEPGDFRDWDNIREWAGNLGDDLRSRIQGDKTDTST